MSSLVIRADYRQQYLLPPSLEDWIPSDHEARAVRDFVDKLRFAELGIVERTAEEGRPSYSPELLISVWVYGYMCGIRSTRTLERACRDQMPFVWLTGNHRPDHNTLWRFFHLYRETFPAIFRQCVLCAMDLGMVGMVIQALDGTKIKSRASKRSGWGKARLEAALAKLDVFIAKAIAEIEATEVAEANDPPPGLPPEFIDAVHRRAVIQSKLDVMREEGRNFYHPLEPDARMQLAGSERTFGYNAQAVVDAKHGIIVAETVVTDENDKKCLVPMLEEVKRNLGATAQTTLADKGYPTTKALGILDAQGIDVTVALPKPFSGQDEGPYAASKFTYDAALDVLICPEGQTLTYRATNHQRAGYETRVYQRKCEMTCPARQACCSSAKGRSVDVNPNQPAVDKQKAKYADPEHRKVLSKRKTMIELVFGHTKERDKFRRFTVGGLENVKGQWSLVMLAYNLKKMWKLLQLQRTTSTVLSG